MIDWELKKKEKVKHLVNASCSLGAIDMLINRTQIAAVAGLVLVIGGTSVSQIASAQANKENHPEMHRALRSLQRAKTELQKSNHDFHGHRAKAQELTQQAIDEVNAALQSDP